ncbi:hypothetical protein [Mucilaginibacter lacusdianchii]|uniref:hypothetical protein n=1 Tax=Mucilaginibacter lacusdianchii TaxID=2684211 RepID=UPI00131ADAC8|nr:hypothetical protein [Mucilaginibacter sp. JXJ CY 39]
MESIDFAIKEYDYQPKFRYSICTLVTDINEYNEMYTSFTKAGFSKEICEFRYIDNIGSNNFDAYKGLNLFLQNANAEFIIICHQDILLNFDKIEVLEKRIEEITAIDKNWAILSNAGGIENDLYQRYTLNVAYPDGKYDRIGKFPQKVVSVDENFILVKRSANLALSYNLKGFHFYGTDLCLIAELLGYSAYVIDFKVTHKSYGTPNESYYNILQTLTQKYRHFMRNRYIVTTIADFYLSASNLQTTIAETKLGKKVSRKLAKIKHKNN